MTRTPLLLLLVCAAAAIFSRAAVTTIELTGTIAVSNTMRFGVNLGGDTYYSGTSYMNTRDYVNFEGTTYRQCHRGTLFNDGFATEQVSTNNIVRYGWSQTLLSGQYTILSGPFAGTTGTIVAISNRFIRLYSAVSNTQPLYVFSDPITLPGNPIEDAGLMVEAMNLHEGNIQRNPTYWLTTNNCFLQQGDVPPSSFGQTACRMNGSSGDAIMRMATSYQRFADNNGVWTSSFWARKVSGAPTVRVAIESSSYGGSVTITPSTNWQRYQVQLTISGVPDGSGHPLFKYTVQGGAVLIDDCEVWKTGKQNPTAFRDDLVALLQDYRPGILRNLQMGGSTVINSIMPPLRAHSYMNSAWATTGPNMSRSLEKYGAHELYELCDYLGAEPWFCLPGTLAAHEITQFMEYLGAPTNVGLGALRAELGRVEPWTKTLGRIHVEFGNEAWNEALGFLVGGYNGPDYWSNLIATAKLSPYYTNSILFHAAGQNFANSMARTILRDTKNADRYAIAPYILQDLTLTDTGYNDTTEKLFQWLFAYPMMTTFSNGMPAQYVVMTNTGVEYSIYEMNHHTTGGDAVLLPTINMLMSSAGAGISVANTMLALLKQYGIRSQCFFNLFQESYATLGGNVWLWGGVLSMRDGMQRYRPTGLAQKALNRVLGGDMLRTIHSGDNPRFTARGRFHGYRSGNPQTNNILSVSFPVLQSYAFRDGSRYGLALFNFDVAVTQSVVLRMPVPPPSQTARAWLLSSPALTANNEFVTGTPQVTLDELVISDFTNGVQLDLPPVSLITIGWSTGLPPQDASISIDGGALTTMQADVSLSLSAGPPDPSVMLLSEHPLFPGAQWEPFAPVRPWTLSEPAGEKTVFALFALDEFSISSAVSSSVWYIPEPALMLPACTLAGLFSVARASSHHHA